MAYTLLIEKTGYNTFWHTHNGNPLTKFAISDFECSIDGTRFKITEFDGAVRYVYEIADITLQDHTDTGALETFTDPVAFNNRLIAVAYTPFLNISNTVVPTTIYTKGDTFIINCDAAYMAANFDMTPGPTFGLGKNERQGLAICNGNNGTKLRNGMVSVAYDPVDFPDLTATGGSRNAVLIGHAHDVPDVMGGSASLGAGGGGNVRINTNKTTSAEGQDENVNPAPTEDGIGKNMMPYTVDLWVERTVDLVVASSVAAGVQDLPAVLAIGDRTFQEISGTAGVYEFQITDRTKETSLDITVANCVLYDDGSWPENSKVEFTTYETPSTFSTTNDVRYQGNTITSLVIYPGDLCYLKKIGTDPLWELVVTNRVVEKKFYCQIIQFDTNPIEIVAGSVKGSGGATLTTSYIGPGEGMITSDLPIFAGAKDFQKNTASLPLNIITSLALGTVISAWQFRVVDDYNLYVSSVYDIFSLTLSDNVLIEPQQLTVEY